MDTSTRLHHHGNGSKSFGRDESLRIPMHLSRYAEEVELWRREAFAAQAARAEGR